MLPPNSWNNSYALALSFIEGVTLQQYLEKYDPDSVPGSHVSGMTLRCNVCVALLFAL